MAKPEPKRISQLDAAGPLTGAEQMPIVQNERTVYATTATAKEFFDTSCSCTLVSRYTDSCTAADLLENYLKTYTLPANTLSTDGSYLEVYMAGTFAANGNDKSVNFYLDSHVWSVPLATYNNYTWFLHLTIQRSTSGTSRTSGKWELIPTSAALQTPEVIAILDDDDVDWTIDQQLAITGTNGTANADDICVSVWTTDLHLLDANS